mgnify:FL=1
MFISSSVKETLYKKIWRSPIMNGGELDEYTKHYWIHCWIYSLFSSSSYCSNQKRSLKFNNHKAYLLCIKVFKLMKIIYEKILLVDYFYIYNQY